MENDGTLFLHRTFAGAAELSRMSQDLSMSEKSIENIGNIVARDVSARDIAALTIAAGNAAVRTVSFLSGAALSNSYISNLDVSGDLSGFKTVAALRVLGSGRASVTADRATIEGEIFVDKDFYLKTDMLRSVSAFTFISAGVLSAQYLSSEIMTLGGGISISRDFLNSYYDTAVSIGKWNGIDAPEFSALKLSKYGDTLSRPILPEEFADIMSAGWK
jgi:hypothetical protein